MIKQNVFISLAVFLLLLQPSIVSYAKQIYKWSDEKGSVHYTDDLSKVPEKYKTAPPAYNVRSKSRKAHRYSEKDYQTAWCIIMNGVPEYKTGDGSRIDCLTDEYAVEVDFAYKWQEAIGQSLFYAQKSGLKPGILLIIEKPKDKKFLNRLSQTIEGKKLIIKIWTIRPEDIRSLR